MLFEITPRDARGEREVQRNTDRIINDYDRCIPCWWKLDVSVCKRINVMNEDCLYVTIITFMALCDSICTLHRATALRLQSVLQQMWKWASSALNHSAYMHIFHDQIESIAKQKTSKQQTNQERNEEKNKHLK